MHFSHASLAIIPNYVAEKFKPLTRLEACDNFVKHCFRGSSHNIKKITFSGSLLQNDCAHTWMILKGSALAIRVAIELTLVE